MKDRELFHPEAGDISLDAILGALSDPIRRDVLRRIADEGALYCGDLSYDVVKSTMSHHFRVLRESGLMHTEREASTGALPGATTSSSSAFRACWPPSACPPARGSGRTDDHPERVP